MMFALGCILGLIVGTLITLRLFIAMGDDLRSIFNQSSKD